jgi:hypothetical protein
MPLVELTASKVQGEKPTAQTSNNKDFVSQLMTGASNWEPFDHKQMDDLTDDSALCHYYTRAQCNTLSEFLALSEKRFDIRGY